MSKATALLLEKIEEQEKGIKQLKSTTITSEAKVGEALMGKWVRTDDDVYASI